MRCDGMRDERKQLLYRYPAIGDELSELAEKIADMESRLQANYGRTGTTLDAERTGHAGPSDPTAESAGQVLKLKARLCRLYAASSWRMEAREKVEGFLERLDALERPVIELRYFRRLSWEEVAGVQAISAATAYRLHASALGKWEKEANVHPCPYLASYFS